MKTLMTLMLGLAMVAFNAFAAVNINTATQEQLETLKGVGPAKAKAIIDYRTKNGPFKKIEDLDKVHGIGGGLMKNLKSEITLTGATTVADTKASPKSAKADDKKADHKDVKPADKKADVKETKPADKKADAKDAKKEEAKKDAKADKGAKKDEKK